MGLSAYDSSNKEPKDQDYNKEELKLDGSVVGEFINRRLDVDRDAKIIITSRSSSTGLGKTTCAVQKCRYIDRNGWSAEEKAFINVNDYLNYYLNESSSGDCLLLDEVEAGADNRRAMSNTNVKLSKAWATMRFKNVVTIVTLPTTSMVDGRLLELADIWINVVNRGLANPYFLWVNDFTGEIRRIKVRHPHTGDPEYIRFEDLSNDPDMEILDKMKDSDVFGESDQTYDSEDVRKEKDKAYEEKRNEIIKSLWENTDLTQKEIGKIVEPEDPITQQSVSHILNKE